LEDRHQGAVGDRVHDPSKGHRSHGSQKELAGNKPEEQNPDAHSEHPQKGGVDPALESAPNGEDEPSSDHPKPKRRLERPQLQSALPKVFAHKEGKKRERGV